MRKKAAFLLAGLVVVVCGLAVAWFVAYRDPAIRSDKILSVYKAGAAYGELDITYPLDETVFPAEIAAPTFCWNDRSKASDAWLLTIRLSDGSRMIFPSLATRWTPSDEQWATIKRRSLGTTAAMTILSVQRRAQDTILSEGRVSFSTSRDEVGAPLFYREVNLPFIDAVKDPSHIRWRFGEISSKEPPPVVLENLPVCGNCHSFAADGAILGMDVDYANDHGSYAIAPVARQMTLDGGKIITWSDYRRDDRTPTFGLLSQVSPDGRYVVSTVKDRSVFVPREDPAFSQLFFPIRGILVVYDRETKEFRALPGADDPELVQSNPVWSPDGKHIVFARSKAYRLKGVSDTEKALLTESQCQEFLKGGKRFLFDLYRIPFNEGNGGEAKPLEGASHNGASNYFPKYSPNGKWIVFCRAKSFMLLQPDSKLYIIPASGGKARRLRCNTSRMNSWHSWSPNSRWLVFSSKANSAYTQLFLTHIDDEGRSSPPVVLSRLTTADRAANIPEFVNASPNAIETIRQQFLDDHSYVRVAQNCIYSGDYEGAARASRKALELNPKCAEALCNLGLALWGEGKIKEAESHLVKAIEYQPDLKEGHVNLAALLDQQERHQEALAHYREALRIDPDSFRARLPLGIAALTAGDLRQATEHLSHAVRLVPDHASARYHLGEALFRQGKLDQAAIHFGRALEKQPDHVPSLVCLASIRAMSDSAELRDGPQAQKLAERACALTGYRHPQALDALAAAYAECGRFQDALKTASLARQYALAGGHDGLANAIQERIELYTESKPAVGANVRSPVKSN